MRLANAIFLTTAILGLALVFPAAAVTVNYTVGGLGPMHFPGPDPVPTGCACTVPRTTGTRVTRSSFVGYTGTLDLNPGTYVKKIGTLYWTIDYTWAGGTAIGTARELGAALFPGERTSPDHRAHVERHSLSDGTLECNWDDDYLGFVLGSTATFSISGTTYTSRLAPSLEPEGLEQWPPILPSSPSRPHVLSAVSAVGRRVREFRRRRDGARRVDDVGLHQGVVE